MIQIVFNYARTNDKVRPSFMHDNSVLIRNLIFSYYSIDRKLRDINLAALFRPECVCLCAR